MAIVSPLFVDNRKQIYSYLDLKDVFRLSHSSKFFYQELGNNFFKNEFFKINPRLKNIQDKLFKDLSSYLPNTFWRAACRILNETELDSFDHFIKKAPFFTSVISVLKKNIPFQKKDLLEQKKIVFGEHFDDPNSLMSQAWETVKKKYFRSHCIRR